MLRKNWSYNNMKNETQLESYFSQQLPNWYQMKWMINLSDVALLTIAGRKSIISGKVAFSLFAAAAAAAAASVAATFIADRQQFIESFDSINTNI